jgi:hypothetical protein
MKKKKIKKWNIYDQSKIDLIPSPKDREWMKNTPNSFAFRCLPLTIANGFGWSMLNKDYAEITWTGGQDIADTTIKCYDENKKEINSKWILSHFGSGVVTFSFDFLFQTEKGHNLYVKGPANNPKRGITALEGIIETDWLPFTFTMNWKITEPNFKIIFEKDEPICQIFPIERFYLESWEAEEDNLSNNKELENKFNDWSSSRKDYIKNMDKNSFGERDYIKGIGKDGIKFEDHQNNIKSCPFLNIFKNK